MKIKHLFPFLALILLISCKKECQDPAPPISQKRISSIRAVSNNNEKSELHFIYNEDNSISKIVRRLNNNDMFIDYKYYSESIEIDRIGSEWESQHINSNGYPDTILTSWDRYSIVDYLSPGKISHLKQFVESSGKLFLTQTYKYEGDFLKEIIEENHEFGTIYTHQMTYSGNKLTQFDNFHITYYGACVSRIEVNNSVDHQREYQYAGSCDLISSLIENTIYPNDSTYKSYEFEYEDGIGVFPFLWQTSFYRLTNLPDFLAHTRTYGGI